MAKEVDEGAQDFYSNPDQQTGFSDDNGALRYYDAAKGEYVTLSGLDATQRRQFADNLSHYQNDAGDFVYGTRPETLNYNPSGEFMREGYIPPTFKFDGGGLTLGGPQDPNIVDREEQTGVGVPGNEQPPAYTEPPEDTRRPDLPQPPDETEIVDWTQELSDKPSWNWDYFAPKQKGDGQWGGYDQDYGVFERYQPGQDSPWGMPDVEGGNEQFYQQQFNNMLRDEQGYRTRQRDSQRNYADALRAEEGDPNINYTDMWESMDYTPNEPGTGQMQPTSFTPNEKYAGMTNQEAWNSMKNLSAFSDRDASGYMDNWLLKNPGQAERSSWGNQSDPTAAYNTINPNSWEGMNHPTSIQNTLQSIMNNMYTAGTQGPTAPIGYASPI